MSFLRTFTRFPTHRGLVVAAGGAVAASQPLAVSAGLAVLARGGSCVDAALAVSAVLCVVEPQSSHLGGDAFVLHFDANTKNVLAFNGSGAAPQNATLDDFADGIPLRGMRAATVPGLVSTWFALHERFGSLPVPELLAPAIGYALNGFPAGPRLVRTCALQADLLRERPVFAAGLHLRGDMRLGEIIRQPELAQTLEYIAIGGRAAFYDGPITDQFVRHSQTHASGHFSREDFVAHQTRVLAPIATRYRNLTVYGQPPPSQGMILLEELALAEGFDLADMGGIDEPTRTHVLIEAKKLAFADRNAYLGDPETAPVPVEALLSPDFIARRRQEIDPDRARPDYAPGDVGQGTDTTYFLVRDRAGNAVSFIQSVFHVFGAAEVVEGTGILLNNRLTGFSLDPASPNVLAPGKRPAHTLNAALATDTATGNLAHVWGTPGGHIQVQTNLQILVNLVDGNMNPQEAIEAPRWQHLSASSAVASEEGGPGVVEIEDRVPVEVVGGLRRRGHAVRVIGPWTHGSSVQALSVGENGVSLVGSDPRSDGHAAGL